MHKLEWAKSTLFSATNGVKQGVRVLSLRLFNVYLSKLRGIGLGCHMNGKFVGTFYMRMILPF